MTKKLNCLSNKLRYFNEAYLHYDNFSSIYVSRLFFHSFKLLITFTLIQYIERQPPKSSTSAVYTKRSSCVSHFIFLISDVFLVLQLLFFLFTFLIFDMILLLATAPFLFTLLIFSAFLVLQLLPFSSLF